MSPDVEAVLQNVVTSCGRRSPPEPRNWSGTPPPATVCPTPWRCGSPACSAGTYWPTAIKWPLPPGRPATPDSTPLRPPCSPWACHPTSPWARRDCRSATTNSRRYRHGRRQPRRGPLGSQVSGTAPQRSSRQRGRSLTELPATASGYKDFTARGSTTSGWDWDLPEVIRWGGPGAHHRHRQRRRSHGERAFALAVLSAGLAPPKLRGRSQADYVEEAE